MTRAGPAGFGGRPGSLIVARASATMTMAAITATLMPALTVTGTLRWWDRTLTTRPSASLRQCAATRVSRSLGMSGPYNRSWGGSGAKGAGIAYPHGERR